MKNKYGFFITLPRSGAKSIIQDKQLMSKKGLFIWPYEFFYFSKFNEASKNKSKEKVEALNKYFYNDIYNKLKNFSKNKIDINKFKINLFKRKKAKLNSLEYLNHLVDCLTKSYINEIKNIRVVLILTTMRGISRSIINSKKVFFIDTDRPDKDSFYSIRNRTIKNSNFYDFYILKGKKSLFYWLETFRILNIYRKKIKNKIKLKFDNIKYNRQVRKKIRQKNTIDLSKKLGLKNNEKKIKNIYFKLYKKKKSTKLQLSQIEKYLIYNYLNNKPISIDKFFFNFFISINFFFKNLKNENFYIKLFKIFYILANFAIFYQIRYDNKKIYNKIIKSNPKIKFEFNWSKNK